MRFRAIDVAGVCLAMLMCILGCQPTCKAPGSLPRIFAAKAFDRDMPNAEVMDAASKYLTYEQELRSCCPELPEMNHKDYAMLAANRAMIEERLGHVEAARQAVLDAQSIMTGVVKDEEGKAIAASVADESAKVFKGECYEIAMLNCLVGLYSLDLGENETAAIGFRRALEADKMSKEEARDDFALAYWGLGMANLDSDPETSAAMFRRCAHKDVSTAGRENVVFLVSMGRAPTKRLYGLYGEQDQIVLEPYESHSAEIFVDGRLRGRAVAMVNLYDQSRGVPRTGKDVGQGAKAGGKFALALAAGIVLGDAGQGLVEHGWAIKADTRACYMLPNELALLSCRIPAGYHTVNVKFHDRAGRPLPRYEQVWHNVYFPSDRREYVWIRSEFDRCNIQGPIAFTRVAKVKADKKSQKTFIEFRAANLPGLQIGDEVRICHFYSQTQERWDHNYHWRYAPRVYNSKGQDIGYPDSRLRMQDYDIGLVGKAKVVQIKNGQAAAEVVSLTTAYVPEKENMVTNAQPVGRIWQQ